MDERRVTLRELAAATGFSANTVSRALKNSPKISKATRSLIQQKAKEMGYVPNLAAASLRLGYSHVLALIVESLTNPFFGMIFNHVDQAAQALGYEVIVFCSHYTEEGELRAIQTARQHGCDGIVLLSCAHGSSTVEFLRSAGTPFVLLVREIEDCRADLVLCDEEEGGRLAARYLMEQGCRRLLYADCYDHPFSMKRRWKGFRDEAEKTPGTTVELLQPKTDDALEANRAAAACIARLCRGGIRPGVAAYCDMKAYGVLSEIARLRGKETLDFELIGFDNIDAITPSSLPLSSVSADYAAMCGAAVELLHRRLRGDESAPRRLEYPMRVAARGPRA